MISQYPFYFPREAETGAALEYIQKELDRRVSRSFSYDNGPIIRLEVHGQNTAKYLGVCWVTVGGKLSLISPSYDLALKKYNSLINAL